MRILILATACLMPAAAFAADFDLGPLRGTEYGASDLGPVADWSGVYLGGFAGYAQSNLENKSGVSSLVANQFRNTTIEKEYNVSNLLQLRSKDARDTGFGGFIGYNFQMDEIVLGVEGDYTSTRLRGTSSDALARSMSTSDGNYNEIALAGRGTTELKGYGTLRARAGYTFGSLMPFVTAGIAIGQVDTTNSVDMRYSAYNTAQNSAYLAGLTSGTAAPFPFYTGYRTFNPAAPTSYGCVTSASCLSPSIQASKSKSTVAVGFTAGAGIELMLTQNIFLRGEYQYAFFNDYDGHKFNVNTVRGGAGIKF